MDLTAQPLPLTSGPCTATPAPGQSWLGRPCLFPQEPTCPVRERRSAQAALKAAGSPHLVQNGWQPQGGHRCASRAELGSGAPWRPTTSSTVALPEGFLEEAASLEQGNRERVQRFQRNSALKTSFQFSISSLLSEGASSNRDPGRSEGLGGGEARPALECALREIPQVLGEGSTALWLFSSVQLLSRVRLFATPWTAACQASLSITNSQSLLKLMSIESVMPSNHLILCHPLLLPSVFPSIRIFSNESALRIRWPKYWSFSFNISPSDEHPGLISFRMDWLDLLAVQGTLKSLLQDCSSKPPILWCSAFFIVQLSHP